jgi:hypothetical protein
MDVQAELHRTLGTIFAKKRSALSAVCHDCAKKCVLRCGGRVLPLS